MTMWRIGCAACQVIGRPHELGAHVDFLAAHLACAGGPRIVLLHQDQVDQDRPVPGWRPRPKLGPPEPGHSQPVVCPIPSCGALGTDERTSTVVWKRTEAGDAFLFCRNCGFTWGPGADADRARLLLRGMNHG